MKLIFTRQLGHKQEMTGFGQWKMQTKEQEVCWVCDQWVYSYIFWDEENAGKQAVETNNRRMVNILAKKIYDQVGKDKIEKVF